MRIVAFTDIHGAYSKVLEILRNEPADVVIVGGDLTTVGSIKEAEEAIKSFQELGRTVLCIAGNMDLQEHDRLFERMNVSINGRGVAVADIGFFGVSGGPKSPLNTPYEISEEEIGKRALAGFADVKQCRVKVFVPHMPPFGTKVDIIHSGIHVGSAAVRDFVEDYKPDLLICGHIHEARGRDAIDDTVIVNCGPAGRGHYVVVEIGKKIEVTMK